MNMHACVKEVAKGREAKEVLTIQHAWDNDKGASVFLSVIVLHYISSLLRTQK